jgi:hypothetical protein
MDSGLFNEGMLVGETFCTQYRLNKAKRRILSLDNITPVKSFSEVRAQKDQRRTFPVVTHVLFALFPGFKNGYKWRSEGSRTAPAKHDSDSNVLSIFGETREAACVVNQPLSAAHASA